MGWACGLLDRRALIYAIVNRPGQSEDSVVARVRIAALRPSHLPPRKVSMDERGTLARDGEAWRLASVAGDPLAGPVLSAPLISSPASDQQRLEEASLGELTQRPATDADPAGLVDETLPPPLELLDLSLADDRFSPILLASAISHILDAWEEASHGSSAPLHEVATPAATDALLHPDGPQQRRFLVDPTLDRWEVLDINTRAHPPSVVVSIHLTAASYEADEQHVTGSDRDRRALSLTWTLELRDGDDQSPHWQLAAATDQ